MKNIHQLIHIVTSKVSICEKITIEGKDYYVEELAHNHANKVWGVYINDEHPDVHITRTLGDISKSDYTAGYKKHSETHSLSDDEVIQYSIWKDSDKDASSLIKKTRIYPQMDGSHKSQIIELEKELLTLFKSTQPTKIYYR